MMKRIPNAKVLTSARFLRMYVSPIQPALSTSREATPSRWHSTKFDLRLAEVWILSQVWCPASACRWQMMVFQFSRHLQYKSRSDEISIAQHVSTGFEGGSDESRSDGTRNIWGGNRAAAQRSAQLNPALQRWALIQPRNKCLRRGANFQFDC